MSIIIRKAISQDFSAICSLIKNELGYTNINEDEAIKRLNFFMDSNDFETFVAELDFHIVGFIGIMKGIAYTVDGYYSQIIALAVSQTMQGRGVGTSLVKKAEEWSLENGITGIGVNSGLHRLKTHEFYEKNGYAKKSYSFSKEL